MEIDGDDSPLNTITLHLFSVCDDKSIHGAHAGSVNYACHIDLPSV